MALRYRVPKEEYDREKWTNEEDAFLITNYVNFSIKKLAMGLNRSFHSVDCRIRRLRIDKRRLLIQKRIQNVKALMEKLTPEDMGYLAGLTDGEGSLSVRVSKLRTGISIDPRVQISNTNSSIINRLEETKLFRATYHRDARSRKRLYDCSIGGYQSLPMLEFIEPHLIGKREHARLLISFIKSRLNHKGQRERYTKEEVEIARKLLLLNKAGKKSLQILKEYEPHGTANC